MTKRSVARQESRKKQGRQTLALAPSCGHHRQVKKTDGSSDLGNMVIRHVNGDDSNMRLVFACARLASSVISYFQTKISSTVSLETRNLLRLARPEVILCCLRTDVLHLPIDSSG